jgi:peroxiredoxin
MVQFVQLQKNLAAFHEAGIEVVALTYDDPGLQQQFIDKNNIMYPFLSDIDASSVKALGILNEDYEPGDGAYGIPHPGIFILNPELKIVGKIFVEGYQKRVSAPAVLVYAKEALNR